MSATQAALTLGDRQALRTAQILILFNGQKAIKDENVGKSETLKEARQACSKGKNVEKC